MMIYVLLVLVLLAEAQCVPDKPVTAAFKEWSERFKTGEEGLLGAESIDLQRFKQFEKNYNFIKRKQGQGLGFEMELNEFAGKSDVELESMVGVNITEVLALQGPASRPRLHSTPIAYSSDHRRDTGLSKPRLVDTAHCGGSSWAYSVVAVTEARYKALTDEIALFSEQEVLDCAYDDGTDGCAGGSMGPGFQYLATHQHLADRRRYRVWGGVGASCHRSSYRNAMSRATVDSFTSLAPGEDNLRREVSEKGPVAVMIHASRSFYFYKHGLFDASECSTGAVNHAVTAVGYQTDRWIVKNCWGPGWGVHGYSYLRRNYANVCKIADYPVTLTLTSRTTSGDDCPHVPEPDREPCWMKSAYTTTQSNCQRQGCCWDSTTSQCFVKAKITVYSERHYRGVNATFYGSIPDLAPYDMLDVVRSVKVHSGHWIGYSEPNYGVDSYSWQTYSLGIMVPSDLLEDLDMYSFSSRLGSLRAVSGGRDVITLFKDTQGRGRALSVYKKTSWVGHDFNDKVSSVFSSKAWVLYKDSNYNGGRVTVGAGLTRNLGQDKFNDALSSVHY